MILPPWPTSSTAPASFFCAIAVLIVAEAAEKSGAAGFELEMAWAVVAGRAVSESFDCAAQGRDAPLRMTISKGRAMTGDAVRLVCLRKAMLASEPTAKVT